MRTQFFKGLLRLGLLSQLACLLACQAKHEDGLAVNTSSKIVEANATMSSEELTDAAEQLLTPTQFMHADKILDIALEKDASNTKAQFYKSFLKSFLSTKGILTRVKPLVKKYGNFTEYENSLENIPNLHIKKFLLAGKEDIQNVKDIQSWFTEYQMALNDFRKFLIVNQDKTFTLELNAQSLEASLKDPNSYSCETIRANEKDYKFKCDMSIVGKKIISTPDLIALRQMTAGYILYLNFYTAYSFEGSELFKTVTIKEGTSPKEVERFISENMPEFGKLRKDNLLKEIIPMGSDLVNAGRWAINYQNQLCPLGMNKPQQRKGALFHEGLCVTNAQESLKSLALLEQLLAKTMKIHLGSKNEEYEVDYFALTQNPVENLLSLTPKDYDNCGQAISLKDPSFGGTFINKDADRWLLTQNVVCKK